MTIRIFERVILTRFKKWADDTDTKIDDLVIRVIEKKLMLCLFILPCSKSLMHSDWSF